MRTVLSRLIRLYQIVVSPLLGAHCRFAPSCSEYARQAVETHGSLRGLMMTLRRLSHCHPWHAGGYDPVPDRVNEETRGHG